MSAARDDAKLRQVPWTADLALRAARVDAGATRLQRVAALKEAVDRGVLGDEAIAALVRGGYSELSVYQRG
jgi:hypothetical protein